MSRIQLPDTEGKSRRQQIITELLSTEFSYVLHLRLLNDNYCIPIKELQLISSKEYESIFQNINKISEINSSLFKQFKARMAEEKFSFETGCIGDIILNIIEDKSLNLQIEYQQYINNYDSSINSLTKIQKNNQNFDQFLKKTLQKDNNFKILQSYLITPIQRLPRYVLLLTELNKITSDDHNDKENIKKALEKVIQLTNEINSGRNFYEEMLKKETLFNNKFSEIDKKIIENNIHPQEIIILESISNDILHKFDTDKKSTPKILILTSNHLLIINKIKSGKKEYKLCFCLSLMSCGIKEQQEGCIELISLERDENAPFIKENFHQIFISDIQIFELWKNNLNKIFKNTMNSSALLNRAGITKEHLKSILLHSNQSFYLLLKNSSENVNFDDQNHYLIKENEIVNHIYFIEEGSIDIIKKMDGNDTILVSLYSGDIFGDISFLQFLKSKKLYPSTASIKISQKNTKIFKISHELLIEKLSDDPDLAWRFYFLIASLIAERVLRINDLISSNQCLIEDMKTTIEKKNILDQKFRSSSKIKQDNDNLIVPQTKTKKTGSYIESNEANPSNPSTSPNPNLSLNKNISSSIKNIFDGKSGNVNKYINEPIEHEFPCSYFIQFASNNSKKSSSSSKKNKPSHGILLFSKNNICLYRKVFGKKTQFIIPPLVIESASFSQVNPLTIVIKYYSCEDFTNIQIQEIIVALTCEKDVELALNLIQKCVAAKNMTSPTPTSRSMAVQRNSFEFDSQTDVFDDECTFCKDDIIMEPGKLSDCVYQVITGICRVEIETSDGLRKIVGEIHPGETIGELSFLLGTVTGAYVIANSNEVVLVHCTWKNLATITTNYASIAASFYKYLAQVLCKRFLTAEKRVVLMNSES